MSCGTRGDPAGRGGRRSEIRERVRTGRVATRRLEHTVPSSRAFPDGIPVLLRPPCTWRTARLTDASDDRPRSCGRPGGGPGHRRRGRVVRVDPAVGPGRRRRARQQQVDRGHDVGHPPRGGGLAEACRRQPIWGPGPVTRPGECPRRRVRRGVGRVASFGRRHGVQAHGRHVHRIAGLPWRSGSRVGATNLTHLSVLSDQAFPAMPPGRGTADLGPMLVAEQGDLGARPAARARPWRDTSPRPGSRPS